MGRPMGALFHVGRDLDPRPKPYHSMKFMTHCNVSGLATVPYETI